ncbi:hypothetical protein SAMN05444392_11612 [Seinonella peptonophila]|uniref:Uncharacterized protein n=2 Tax=Seinonella peptonophila TaxID=112248 RepID=A0A1M5AUN8_9BACL|nr:hypothetical protein SAMN05444392_11612 [Seinonella peptonophila]
MGEKPALIEYSKSNAFLSNKHLLMHYPHILTNDYYIFFQTIEQKNEFIPKLRKVKFDSPEFRKLVGLEIGYPPKAVDFYVKYSELEKQEGSYEINQLESHRVSIRYAGIRCVCHLDDLIECFEWLWEKYPSLDDTPKVLVGTTFYPIHGRQDIENVRQIVLKNVKELV